METTHGRVDVKKMASRDRVAQAKSRAERSRPPTVPVPQIEIVPGRLCEAEWLSLLGFEEAEDGVGDILAGLLDQVLEECYKVYLARQCIPYVISQAREAMLQIVEWRFLVRDEGESAVPGDPTWQEDEEPVACITDSWAQGSVPVLQAMPSPEEGQEEVPLAEFPEEVPIPEEMPQHQVSVGSLLWEELLVWKPPPEKVKPAKSYRQKGMAKLKEEESPPRTLYVKSRATFEPYLGSSRRDTLKNGAMALDEWEKQLLLRQLSQVPVDEMAHHMLDAHPPLLPPSCSNLLRIQVGRPPNTKDVFYDEAGNITLVPKLDPARLPKRWIKPHVEVVDPAAESQRQEALKTVSGRCKQRRRPKPSRLGPPGVAQLLLWAGPAKATRKILPEQVDRPTRSPGKTLEPTSLIFVKPTLLMENIDLAPGVTIQGSGSTKRGGLQPAADQEESEEVPGELRPLCPWVPFPVLHTHPARESLPQIRPAAVLSGHNRL